VGRVGGGEGEGKPLGKGGRGSLWSGVWGSDCKLTKETVIKKPA